MAKQETDIVNKIMQDVSPRGARLFRNVRGLFYAKESVQALIAAIRTGDAQKIVNAVKMLRQLMAGLQANGSSDLIGFTPVKITESMVGLTMAIFTAVEVKTADGRVDPDQRDFVNFIQMSGGYAGIARSIEDARKIMHLGVDGPHVVR